MKLLSSLLLLFFLAGCQVTSPVTSVDSEVISGEEFSEIYPIGDEEEGLAHLVKEKPQKNEKKADKAGYENIWLKLAEGFDFDVPDNSRIAKQRDYYLRHPKYLHQVSKRAEPFLFLIVEQIESKDLPLELALLPIVESAFDPFAYSHASASGLWQFMSATGDRFGLNQDWWYDGRRDVYASTDAALRYMDILHGYLGEDWLYAFAAYNSGEGRVKRAVQKNKKQGKPADFWNLSLPKETENYVPKLLALVDILRNHEKYGVELPYIQNEQVLSYVDTESQLDLAYAAKLADLTIAEIQLLNPAFNHWATSPDGPHKLLIPTAMEQQFTDKLTATDKSERVRWARYKVRAGDSLSVIAKNYNTTTSILKQVNDISGSFIKVRQPLLIPVASKSQTAYLFAQTKRFEAENSKGKRKVVHTIVDGDTLWDISRRYNVTAKNIAKWNQITTKKTLNLGKKLTIWKDSRLTATSKKKIRRVTYHVRSGDSLGVIAQKFSVKTADLVRWNKLQNKKYIKPGQRLLVYVDVRKTKH